MSEGMKKTTEKLAAVKNKITFATIIFIIVLYLSFQILILQNASVRYLLTLGCCVHNVMYLSLIFKLKAEKRHYLNRLTKYATGEISEDEDFEEDDDRENDN